MIMASTWRHGWKRQCGHHSLRLLHLMFLHHPKNRGDVRRLRVHDCFTFFWCEFHADKFQPSTHHLLTWIWTGHSLLSTYHKQRVFDTSQHC